MVEERRCCFKGIFSFAISDKFDEEFRYVRIQYVA